MPYKANEARRHKIPRARYKVRNWPAYDRALQQRGSLTLWVTPEALAALDPPPAGPRVTPLRPARALRDHDVPLQDHHRSGPARPDSPGPEDRSPGRLRGAQPDDPAWH